MDKERQIRFLYPPLFLVCSVLFAFALDEVQEVATYLEPIFGTSNGTGVANLITLLTAGGALVLVSGFAIGTLTHLILSGLFVLARPCRPKAKGVYETFISKDAYQKVL